MAFLKPPILRVDLTQRLVTRAIIRSVILDWTALSRSRELGCLQDHPLWAVPLRREALARRGWVGGAPQKPRWTDLRRP